MNSTGEDIVLTLLTLLFGFPRTFQTNSRMKMKDLPAECFTAQYIKDDTRIFMKPLDKTITYDDLGILKGWYRFGSGTPEIPANSLQEGFPGPLKGNKQNGPNFCGTDYPGTLMGTHPTVEEGIVAMTVCFRRTHCFYNKIVACRCKSKRTIYVRNCIRHFIYWLVPTGRRERYCTGLVSHIPSNISRPIECYQHKILNDPTRIWDVITSVQNEDTEGWVRFGSQSGNELASSCHVNKKPISRDRQPCGAKFRGWMKDSHPSIHQGRVNRRICFSYPGQCEKCQFYANVYVRKCGTFFVYRLEKPAIDGARYCGKSPQESSTIINDLVKPRFQPQDICNISKIEQSVDRLWSNTNPTVLKCDADLYGKFIFRVTNVPLTLRDKCNKTDMRIVQHRCTSVYQGYMEGNHPSISEGYVERIVCFQSNLMPCECHFTAIIGVQNCGNSTFAYDLRGVPVCDARYCMDVQDSVTNVADPFSQPVYGIPTRYNVESLPSQRGETQGKNITYDDLFLIIVLLGATILFLLVIFLLVLFCFCCVVRPLTKKEKNE